MRLVRTLRPLALALALATSAAAVTLVAPGDAYAQKAKPAAAAGAKRARVLEKIRAVRAARLVEILGLDEATATKLFAALNRYDDQILPLKAEIGQARREIRVLIESGKLDDATGNKLIDKILAARAQITKLEDQRGAEVRKILTTKQFALLIVALPEIDREIERAIRRAAARKLGGGGGGLGADDDFE